MSSIGEGGPARLTPAMNSRRLQVLDFIRAYIAGHNQAPSLSETAAGCGIARSRAHQLVRALIKQGHLMRRDGMRGLILPSAIEEAKRQLREAGYTVDEAFDPPRPRGCTETRLLPPPDLDYAPGDFAGDGSGDTGDGQMGEAAPRSRRG